MRKLLFLAVTAAIMLAGCAPKEKEFKVWAWMAGKVDMPEETLERYFQKSAEAGIDAIFIECHTGVPPYLGNSTLLEKSAALLDGKTTPAQMAAAGEDTSWIHDPAIYRDSAAIQILTRAAVYAKKYNIELHAWMWTANRGEKLLRNLHHDWYAVNGKGESTADIKMYNREHYRFLCPNHDGVTEYLKERVREIATIDGLTGIHMDFIRYPDAILPYALHESRGVVQDRVYPDWDCCYCDVCRAKFKEQTGIDPLDLEDPTANQEWMEFRWKSLADMASAVAEEIKACGKVSSAAVFATPEESKKLVRQDWVNFRNVDFMMPMIYNHSYGKPNAWIEDATKEGIEGLKAAGSSAVLRSGMAVGPRDGADSLILSIDAAKKGGATGVVIFSLNAYERTNNWDMLIDVVKRYTKAE